MIRQHIFRTILFALIGVAIGFGIVSTSPKIYEGRAQMIVGTQSQNSMRAYPTTITADVAAILEAGLATNPQTEIQILRGEGVFKQALSKVAGGDAELISKADDLYNLYDVANSGDASEVLVRARAYKPEIARDLANSVADVYNERRQQTQREAVAEALTYLENQISQEKTDLSAAEDQLNAKQEELNLPVVSANIARKVEYQSQLQAQIDAARAELAGVEQSIGDIQQQMDSRPKTEPGDDALQMDQRLLTLESKLVELETQRKTALVQYLEDADQIKFIDSAIADVKAKINALKKDPKRQYTTVTRVDSIRRTMEARLADAKIAKDNILKKMSTLEGYYNTVTGEVNQIPDNALMLSRLARDVEIKENNYKRLATMHEDLKNRSETIAKAAQIVYQAVEDPNPVLPRPALIYVVSVLGGAIFGLLISFAVEAMRLRIYTSTQLQELTGLPVAGVVHDLPGPTARRLLTSAREANPVIAESYRFLAFAAMSNKNGGPKKVLLTGIDNNAGCSTTAVQFATALAQAGSRVVLADCALDDPTITKTFGLDQKSGISDILSQTQLPSPDSEPGGEAATANLRVVGAGTEGKNAIKVATTQNISGMIGALASNSDVLVIDSMPCLASSDAARLVPYVDEVYLVVNAKTANMRNVAAAIDVLTLASAASVKFVFTKGNRGEEGVMKQANLASARA